MVVLVLLPLDDFKQVVGVPGRIGVGVEVRVVRTLGQGDFLRRFRQLIFLAPDSPVRTAGQRHHAPILHLRRHPERFVRQADCLRAASIRVNRPQAARSIRRNARCKEFVVRSIQDAACRDARRVLHCRHARHAVRRQVNHGKGFRLLRTQRQIEGRSVAGS